MISKEFSEFLGCCGLKLNEENLIDLGFRFFQREWGKGYATESAKASLEYGFNNLKINEIIGRASIDNKASISTNIKAMVNGGRIADKDNLIMLRHAYLARSGTG